MSTSRSFLSQYGLVSAFFIALIISGIGLLMTSLMAVNSQQDIRGQAYQTNSCVDAPVNVQFRKATGAETSWSEGNGITVKAGELIDVNCFAKNGAALLSQASLTATVVDPTTNTTSQVTLTEKSPGEIRNLQVLKAGTYSFKCISTSNAACTNTDTLAVTGTSVCQPRPACLDATPACKIAEPVGGWCPSFVSDINRDGKITIEDYRLFLEDYQKNFSL